MSTEMCWRCEAWFAAVGEDELIWKEVSRRGGVLANHMDRPKQLRSCHGTAGLHRAGLLGVSSALFLERSGGQGEHKRAQGMEQAPGHWDRSSWCWELAKQDSRVGCCQMVAEKLLSLHLTCRRAILLMLYKKCQWRCAIQTHYEGWLFACHSFLHFEMNFCKARNKGSYLFHRIPSLYLPC